MLCAVVVRELNKHDNAKGARATDALLNYETGSHKPCPVLPNSGRCMHMASCLTLPQLCMCAEIELLGWRHSVCFHFPALTSLDPCGCSDAVMYFNNEALERSNFAKAVDDYLGIEYQVCLCFIFY